MAARLLFGASAMASQLLTDLQHGVRLLRKAPLFTTLVIASLGIGIGANGAIFTLLDQIVLRPLPVERADRLVQITIDGEFEGDTWGDGTEISYPMFLDLRDHEAFAGMFARMPWALHVNARGRTERINGELVSGRYFGVLRVPAAIGRVITDEDDRMKSGAPVAVLSHAYWRSHYGSDPAVIGQTLTVNSHTFTVIGVARDGFDGINVGRATDMWVPMAMKPLLTPGWDDLDRRRARFARVFGRLKDGVDAAGAQAALQPLFKSIRAHELADAVFAGKNDDVKKRFADARLVLTPGARGSSGLTEGVATPLWILMGIGGVVLLVACANVAGLLLARGMGRQREVAIRLALGASRTRIAVQLLLESLLLGALGSGAGLLVATWTISPLMILLVGADRRTAISTALDVRVLTFMMILGCVTALLFGVAPAVQASGAGAGTALKDRSATAAGRADMRTRKTLVAAQVALSVLLVAGSVLFLRSLQNLLSQNPGFVTSNLAAFSVEPSLNGYSPARVIALTHRLRDELKRMPEVSSVGFLGVRLLEGGSWNSGMTLTATSGRQSVYVFNNTVSPGYFATMGIPLLLGRDFTDRDRRDATATEGEERVRSAIVNQRFVDMFLKGANRIGARLGFGQDPNTPTPIEIVGVVGTSKYVGLKDEAEAQAFYPMLEAEPRRFTAYVRTSGTVDAVFGTVRRVMQNIDPTLPIYDLMTMEMQVARSVADDRMIAILATVLACIGTVLCVLGLYGVVAYTVSRRTREVGIRMALGALGSQVTLLFFREAAGVVAVGVVAAVPLLYASARYIQAQLYGIDALNPQAIAGAIALLGAVALIGALVPALRAARIQPLTALREE
jgi:predicted permease